MHVGAGLADENQGVVVGDLLHGHRTADQVSVRVLGGEHGEPGSLDQIGKGFGLVGHGELLQSDLESAGPPGAMPDRGGIAFR